MSEQDGAISIEEPFPGDPAAPEPVEDVDDDAEPEGAVEVAPGRRMVDVSVVAAERKRARELAAKEIREKELEPLKAKAAEADTLRQTIESFRPIVEAARAQLQQQQQPPEPTYEESVTHDEAEAEARDLELFDPTTGKPDIARATRIIAKRRQEAAYVGQQAAQQAMAPIARQTAEQAQRTLFAQMAQELGADDILSPSELAQQFVELGPELTQHPQVARVALERAIGRAYLAKRAQTGRAPSRAPVVSESPGGQRPTGPVFTDHAKRLGLSEADVKSAAKTFNPGGVSQIGEW